MEKGVTPSRKVGLFAYESEALQSASDDIDDIIEKIIDCKGKDEMVLDYADLFKKCWSSEPDQRPTLTEILSELGRLSKEKTVEFITNVIHWV
ncbi:140_t:CDS:2 [Dentiscutata erythropus]|uniref:140_t:CDS:1 n=1 Tax=Dentiscutata erythropus TaxID=1348616 RepID=A0A9N9BD11_9GLOM|nr:140_t:CDS:2 [Dentiscutata erythropus]